MTKKVFFVGLLAIIMLSQDLRAQRFKATALAGINLSQIDGDNLYGFNKMGVTAGGRLSYANSNSLDLAIEMLYSQRGSAVKLFKNNPGDKISLNYLELPLIVSLRDWYVQSGDYHKVRVDGGFSYGYLFGTDASGFNEAYFRKHDVSWLLGAGVRFTKFWGLSLRYTSSLYTMYKDPSAPTSSLKGYFITLRSEFNF